MTVSLSGDFSQMQEVFNRIEDLIPFYDRVGEYAVLKTRERLHLTKISPDGSHWAPWTLYTLDRRILKGNVGQGLLWDTGALLNDVRFEVDGNFGVSIGTYLEYGLTLQEGIPGTQEPRPWLGWDENDKAAIMGFATEYFITGVM